MTLRTWNPKTYLIGKVTKIKKYDYIITFTVFDIDSNKFLVRSCIADLEKIIKEAKNLEVL